MCIFSEQWFGHGIWGIAQLHKRAIVSVIIVVLDFAKEQWHNTIENLRSEGEQSCPIFSCFRDLCWRKQAEAVRVLVQCSVQCEFGNCGPISCFFLVFRLFSACCGLLETSAKGEWTWEKMTVGDSSTKAGKRRTRMDKPEDSIHIDWNLDLRTLFYVTAETRVRKRAW